MSQRTADPTAPAPPNAELDTIELTLDQIRQVAGPPSRPDVHEARTEIKRQIDQLALGPMLGGVNRTMFDQAAENSINAIATTWRTDAANWYRQVVGRLEGLTAKLEGFIEAVDLDVKRQRAAVSNIEQVGANAFGRVVDAVPLIPAPGSGAPVPPGPAQGELDVFKRRRWAEWLFVLVLLIAAGIDIATFYQVFALVVFNLPGWAVWMGVVGFTAAALTLAHLAGREAKSSKLRTRHALRSRGFWVCISVWFALAVVAFVVRAVAPASGTGSTIQINGVDQALPNSGGSWLPALLFLALYLATGTLTAVHAFGTYNPDRVAYHNAQLHGEQATRQLKVGVRDAARAKNLRAAVEHEQTARKDVWQQAEAGFDAIIADLKTWAANQIDVLLPH